MAKLHALIVSRNVFRNVQNYSNFEKSLTTSSTVNFFKINSIPFNFFFNTILLTSYTWRRTVLFTRRIININENVFSP